MNQEDLSDLVRLIEAQEAEDAQITAQQQTPPATRRPGRKSRVLVISLSIAGALVLAGGATAWALIALGGDDAEPVAATTQAPETTATPEPTATPTPEPTPEPDPAAAWNIDDPASIQVVVNKQRPLTPIDWEPSDLVLPNIPNSSGQPLRTEASQALEAMYAEAQAEGLPFAIVSGFRGYTTQDQLFSNYAASDGVEAAETYSARPGHSEHQTGLAVDISECLGCPLSEAFGETSQGLWARDNAHRFGFILRYDQGEQPVVGYVYEPWHFRYVGVDIATDMHNTGVKNLEDYFDLPAAPNYS